MRRERIIRDVLLVEDSAADVRLIREALNDTNQGVRLHVESDGAQAMAFLKHEGEHHDALRPDVILLDLNLPRMDGRDVLKLIKQDENLKAIPTVILTTSDAEADIVESYHLQANCFFTKPVQLDAFNGVVKSIVDFWMTRARLPNKAETT